MGCSLGPGTALDWFFAQESEGIILEDDCVPHPDFFTFATEMLDRYRFNKKIISINGSNLGYTLENGNSYTFSRFMNMWGWATWKRSYEQIDYQLDHWKNVKQKNLYLWRLLRFNLFDIDLGWIKYWRFQFDKTITTKKITWWDYQWIYYQLINKKYAILPANNLVKNIGFDENGHHTIFANSPAANLPLKSMPLPYKHPLKIKPDIIYEDLSVKKIWCSYSRLSSVQTIKQIIKEVLKFN
jgi:hypothetical protein